jgi:IS30 family transposase
VVPGHGEGDLIMGTRNRSAIATLVERNARYLMLPPPAGRNRAEELCDGLIKATAPLPARLAENADLGSGQRDSQACRIHRSHRRSVYFCDPCSPWQRGWNENTVSL